MDRVTVEESQGVVSGVAQLTILHDGYLQKFNESNATLVNTAGKGIGGDVDVVILRTGFFESFPRDSCVSRLGIDVNARGLSLDEKPNKAVEPPARCFTHGFQDFVLIGLTQAGSTVNIVPTMDLYLPMPHVIATARETAGPALQQKILIELTIEAEEAWSLAVAGNAYAYAAFPDCALKLLRSKARE
ncbi:hypothetical protein BDW66DRAFT_153723 [Aspergillus desertorum]